MLPAQSNAALNPLAPPRTLQSTSRPEARTHRGLLLGVAAEPAGHACECLTPGLLQGDVLDVGLGCCLDSSLHARHDEQPGHPASVTTYLSELASARLDPGPHSAGSGMSCPAHSRVGYAECCVLRRAALYITVPGPRGGGGGDLNMSSSSCCMSSSPAAARCLTSSTRACGQGL